MGMFDNLLARFGIVTENAFKQELKKLERWHLDTADAQQWVMPDPYIYANQADFYRLDPDLSSALDILAEDVGNATFNVKRQRGSELVDMDNHEFETLLENPNPLATGTELLADTVTDYKLNGNAVWWLSRQSWTDKPAEIWYIPFHQIQPVPNGRMYLSHYNYFPGNGKTEIPIPTWQIVHFKTRNPFNRYLGLSPIESLGDVLVGGIGMRKTTRTMYVQRNGEPPSILAFKDYIQDEAWADIRSKIKQSAEENKMMLLRGAGESVTWMSRVLSNKDMDFIEQLRQNTRTIFNRMTPGLLAMLDENSTEANAMAARATYAEKSLWRMMQVIAKKITKEILYVYAWGEKLRGEFDDPRVVDRKLELEEQAAFERSHTIEEVRKQYYNDDPLGDDRDKLFVVQVNSATGDGTEPPVKPQPFGRPNTDMPAEEMVIDDTGQDDVSAKSAIADLIRWRRMALGGKTEKAQAFKSDHIPAKTMADIKRRLPLLTAKADIERMFDVKIDGFKPKPKVDPLQVLKGLELTVKALEQKG